MNYRFQKQPACNGRIIVNQHVICKCVPHTEVSICKCVQHTELAYVNVCSTPSQHFCSRTEQFTNFTWKTIDHTRTVTQVEPPAFHTTTLNLWCRGSWSLSISTNTSTPHPRKLHHALCICLYKQENIVCQSFLYRSEHSFQRILIKHCSKAMEGYTQNWK